MGKKVPKSAKTKTNKGRVPESATELKGVSTDALTPVFSFKYTDKSKWTLSEWKDVELTGLLECFKTMGNLTWSQVKSHSGLRYKPIDSYPSVGRLKTPYDMTVCEVRVCGKKRVLGFREGNIFFLLWFDRGHLICAEGKNRKYK
ncbi:hypothetical protein [Clostridium algidicarnis]|uniref:hypothetical protein n=1 Tax=Clostridium algidicarnis TaxID=37659 RepID=UPI001C0C3BF6|nr:hypothetical protein [Clostridium algidicarnis]MBU3205110.1 hypothetical protein [Clostridium algidicarnis]MBU3213263.1 hypothetical protein [Clostridium algidicarnis]MBU3223842.1 hypothetical protein [Clostridium algidicarnis]